MSRRAPGRPRTERTEPNHRHQVRCARRGRSTAVSSASRSAGSRRRWGEAVSHYSRSAGRPARPLGQVDATPPPARVAPARWRRPPPRGDTVAAAGEDPLAPVGQVPTTTAAPPSPAGAPRPSGFAGPPARGAGGGRWCPHTAPPRRPAEQRAEHLRAEVAVAGILRCRRRPSAPVGLPVEPRAARTRPCPVRVTRLPRRWSRRAPPADPLAPGAVLPVDRGAYPSCAYAAGRRPIPRGDTPAPAPSARARHPRRRVGGLGHFTRYVQRPLPARDRITLPRATRRMLYRGPTLSRGWYLTSNLWRTRRRPRPFWSTDDASTHTSPHRPGTSTRAHRLASPPCTRWSPPSAATRRLLRVIAIDSADLYPSTRGAPRRGQPATGTSLATHRRRTSAPTWRITRSLSSAAPRRVVDDYESIVRAS